MKPEYYIKNIEDWDKLAQDLSHELKPGAIIALSGPLGAGKTTFVQSLARTLEADTNPRSPTFSLMRTYALTENPQHIKRLMHVDAYRLEKPTDVLALNLDEELSEPGTILALEWPENIEQWLAKHRPYYFMEIKLGEDSVRTVTIEIK